MEDIHMCRLVVNNYLPTFCLVISFFFVVQSIHDGSSSECLRSIANAMMERVEHLLDIEFDDLDLLRVVAYNAVDVENAVQKYSTYLEHTVTSLIFHDFAHLRAPYELIDKMFDMICKAWAVPNCKLGYELCKTLRDSGGLDFLMDNCMSRDKTLQSSSARLLEQCLTTENHEYILEKGVEKLLRIVCEYKNQISSVDKLNDSTGEIYFFTHLKYCFCQFVFSFFIKMDCFVKFRPTRWR